MKKKLALLTAGALLSAAAAVPASAAVARRDANANAQARQVEPLKGAARDMPLGQAIHAIVPREFTVRTGGIARELLEQPVSWSGGRAWTEVLEDLLDPYPELALEVALGARRVTVRQLPPGARSAARAEMEQAMRREARAESMEALPRTRAVLTQRGAVADAIPVHPQPAANTAQEATLAVMQMAIQTTTQTAIQSAVQAALQYANQTGRPGGGRESQAGAAPAASTVPQAAQARTAPAPASAAALGGAPGTGTTAPAPATASTSAANASIGAGTGGVATAAAASSAGKALSAAPSLGVPAASAGSQQAPSAARAAGSGGAGAPAAAATALATAGGGAAATAASNAPAAAKAPAQPTWEILPADRSVRTALERWTASAGWQLSWELAVDYPVAARTSISGSFETAVEAVAQSLGRAEVPLKAIMYRGNRVLRIVAKGAE